METGGKTVIVALVDLWKRPIQEADHVREVIRTLRARTIK